MSGDTSPKNIIEPFDPARHDRTAFSSGVEQVDNFFRKTANKLAQTGNARVYVMTAPDGQIIGFYALNAHAIDYQDLPKKFARTRPGHGSIPAAFLSMIGMDQRYAGQGYGGDLLVDALMRVARAADQVGIAVVLLDVLDDGNPVFTERRARLYAGYGFVPLPSNPLRMFLPVGTIRKLLDEGDAP